MAKRVAATGPVDGPWALPDGWRWERLGAVAHVNAGQSPPSAQVNKNREGLPFFQGKADFGAHHPTARNWCAKPTKIAEANDVLISVRAPVGPTNYALERCGIGRGLAAIRSDTLCQRYIRHWLAATGHLLREKATGTTFEAITGDVLRHHVIPVPPSGVDETIVARIDELFAEVDDGEAALARARDDLATWRKALLKAAVTGELTADWRTSNPPTETGDELLSRVLADRRIRWEATPKNKGKAYAEPIGPEGDNLPALHPGWAWASLAQIASEQERSFQSGPFGSALLHSEFQDTGHLVIGIDNVQQGYFSKGADHRISEEKFQELRRFQARPKDVLITVMATIGRTCVVPEDVEDAIVTKHLYRITTAKNVANPTFVSTCLRAGPSTVNYLFGNTLGQTRPGLNKSILERAPVPIAPLAEQERALQIVADQIEGTSAILDDLKGCSATLRQSILAAAFRGDLV